MLESHSVPDEGREKKRRMGWLALLNTTLPVVEIVTGFLIGSVVIKSDGIHNLTDGAAFTLAWICCFFPNARLRKNFAVVNYLTLLIIAVWIILQSVPRVMSPVPVHGMPVLIIGFISAIFNFTVHRLAHPFVEDEVVASAATHVYVDGLLSIAAVAAGVLIMAFHWYFTDPLFGLLISVWIIYSTVKKIKELIQAP